jgi:hypothetical protein
MRVSLAGESSASVMKPARTSRTPIFETAVTTRILFYFPELPRQREPSWGRPPGRAAAFAAAKYAEYRQTALTPDIRF